MITMKTKTKICWDCQTRRISDTVMGPDLCDICLNYADHENMHNDDGHEDGTEKDGFSMMDCMVCHPELDNRKPKQSHTNTVAKTRGSHAGCDHPVTPKARAACRKNRAAGKQPAVDRAIENMKKADAKVRVREETKVTAVADLPMPKLTPAQLASPTIRSMMKQ